MVLAATNPSAPRCRAGPPVPDRANCRCTIPPV